LASVPSPWTTTTGANLCYRYVNGVKSTQPLWPWPMNERIKAATAMAGNYAGPCPTCSGPMRANRVATDVMAEIEVLLGKIPDQCKSGTSLPAPSPSTDPTPSNSTTFALGQRVQVNELGPANVRTGAGGTLLGTQPIGTFGTITGKPMGYNDLIWWPVDYDSGIDGWSTEGLLLAATPAPVPPSDTVAPIVAITSPANGTVVQRRLAVSM
jgi:hypothetical protein